jgi:sugar transferase (PEP-CTERM/EpsH1 system associated)
MNILFLAHRIPYPPDKGDKIRSYNEIKYLSKSNNIYLGTILDQRSDEKYITELKRYCVEIHAVFFKKTFKLLKGFLYNSSLSVSAFYDSSLQKYVNKILKEKEIEVVVCFCSTMAEYIFRTPLFKNRRMGEIKLIMDYIDLDSDKWNQYAKRTRFPLNLLYMMEHRRLFKYEIRVNRSFHHSVFVSQREVDVFKKVYPGARNVRVISNGVDSDYFTPRRANYNSKPVKLNTKPILVFTGVMDYFANEDGVKWFCNSVFNRIRDQIPEAQFYIVGNRPTKMVQKLSMIEGVTVTGFVEDIREYYWMADVCVVPLRIARGLQNKILEAMATGNAIVATTNARDGIIAHEKIDIITADDEETFAKEVVSLLKDEQRRKEMGVRAVENIIKNYLWDENLKKFDGLIQNKQIN